MEHTPDANEKNQPPNNTELPFSGGPGSAWVYGPYQCSPRCEGTKDNPCMLAVNRNKGVR